MVVEPRKRDFSDTLFNRSFSTPMNNNHDFCLRLRDTSFRAVVNMITEYVHC